MDTGSWFCSYSLISYLKSQGVNKLDVYVSHMHLDHMGGHQNTNGGGTLSYSDKTAKSKKTYYYKVRAYIKYSSTSKLYGKYTKPVKVKTK